MTGRTLRRQSRARPRAGRCRPPPDYNDCDVRDPPQRRPGRGLDPVGGRSPGLRQDRRRASSPNPGRSAGGSIRRGIPPDIRRGGGLWRSRLLAHPRLASGSRNQGLDCPRRQRLAKPGARQAVGRGPHRRDTPAKPEPVNPVGSGRSRHGLWPPGTGGAACGRQRGRRRLRAVSG